MDLFGHLHGNDFGELHIKVDKATGLKAIIAVHDTRLGPALGGCRFIHYDTDEQAVVDALRLGRGMTYKAALAGLRLGGGKSVLVKPQGSFDRTALFKAFGRFINDLGGHYITAEDSGTSVEDMDVVRGETKHVTGVSPKLGGSGDPSPFTALGVRRGIEACVKAKLDRDSLEGVHVAVQGIGHVGYYLCKELHALGAKLSVADIDPLKAERAKSEFGATVVELSQIGAIECDVFAPCALGAGINDESIPQLRAKIVAGAANNQLATPAHGLELAKRGILYAPDYALNAGGLINVACEIDGYDAKKATDGTMRIYDTLLEIAQRSIRSGEASHVVADRMVEEKLAAVAR